MVVVLRCGLSSSYLYASWKHRENARIEFAKIHLKFTVTNRHPKFDGPWKMYLRLQTWRHVGYLFVKIHGGVKNLLGLFVACQSPKWPKSSFFMRWYMIHAQLDSTFGGSLRWVFFWQEHTLWMRHLCLFCCFFLGDWSGHQVTTENVPLNLLDGLV